MSADAEAQPLYRCPSSRNGLIAADNLLNIAVRLVAAALFAFSALFVSEAGLPILVMTWVFCAARLFLTACMFAYRRRGVVLPQNEPLLPEKRGEEKLQDEADETKLRRWGLLLAMSVCYTAYSGVFIAACKLLPVGLAVTLVYLSPVVAVWIDRLMGGGSRVAFFASALGATGVALAYPPWGDHSSILGLSCALVAAALGGGMPFINRALAAHGCAWDVQTFGMSVISTFILLPSVTLIACLVIGADAALDWTQAAYAFDHATLYCVGAAVFNSLAFCFLVIAYSIAKDVTHASVFGYTEIPIALVLQIYVQDIPAKTGQFVGTALILLAAVVIVLANTTVADTYVGAFTPVVALNCDIYLVSHCIGEW